MTIKLESDCRDDKMFQQQVKITLQHLGLLHAIRITAHKNDLIFVNQF